VKINCENRPTFVKVMHEYIAAQFFRTHCVLLNKPHIAHAVSNSLYTRILFLSHYNYIHCTRYTNSAWPSICWVLAVATPTRYEIAWCTLQ